LSTTQRRSCSNTSFGLVDKTGKIRDFRHVHQGGEYAMLMLLTNNNDGLQNNVAVSSIMQAKIA
jgi:hypothetical protein